MKLDPDLLKSALCRAIDDYLFLYGLDELALSSEYYWKVSDDQLFDIGKKPDDFQIGDYGEEYSAIQDALKRGDLIGSVLVEHLASILYGLSARAGSGADISSKSRDSA
jgi:hypothetical protein